MNSNKKIKVGIIGLGPIGMILAVKLKEAGCEVALCERNEAKAAKIKSDGITLENVINASAKFEMVCTSISELQGWDADYLFFSLKTHQTPGAVKEAEALNTEKLTVISAQNGIDVEELLVTGFGRAKTLRLVINFAGSPVAPNVTKVNFVIPPNFIGSINDSRIEQANEIAGLLSSVGMETKAVNSFELSKKSW